MGVGGGRDLPTRAVLDFALRSESPLTPLKKGGTRFGSPAFQGGLGGFRPSTLFLRLVYTP